MKIQIGLGDYHRQAIAEEMMKILADENLLYMKTKYAQWNIEEGVRYHTKSMFKEQSVLLHHIINRTSEKIRFFGHYVPANLTSYLSLAHLKEQTAESNDSKIIITELLKDHQNFIIILRQYLICFPNDIRDTATCYFIACLVEEHEKMAWFLRSHLE